jgi:hypothetical protein
MMFSLRRITAAFAGPEPGLRWRRDHFDLVMAELHRRGNDRHESGAFLLGDRTGRCPVIRDVVYYDDLDPTAYEQGICILRGPAFGKLWALCRERELEVIADVHTHGGAAGQSHSDRTNPMIAQSGHFALIVPDFARAPVRRSKLGIYRYLGNHAWTTHSGGRWRPFLSFARA